ncbi:MAG: hypothetical protein NXI31_14630 [bacterium]|nr:hypothetical protein [bacterium]
MTKSINDELQQTARQALAGMHPVRPGEEPGGLPLRRLLAAVFRARYLIFGTTLFGILVGTFLAITTANSYVSTGKFVLSAAGAEATRVETNRSIETSQETIGTAATYILSTDELLRRVVKRVGPERILAPYQPASEGASAARAFFYNIQRNWNATKTEDMTPDEALKHLRNTIVIDRPRFTDVLVATCEANNPELAQEILSAYLDEARKYHIEVYDDLEAYNDAEKTAKASLEVRNRARDALREFLKKNQLADFEVDKERLQEAEINAATRAAKVKDDLDIKRGVYQKFSEQLEGPNAIKRMKTEKRPEDVASGALEELNRQLARLMVERAEATARLRDPNNSEIKNYTRQISSTRDAMNALREDQRNAEEISVEVENPAWVDADRERREAQNDITRLESEHASAKEIDKAAKVALKRVLDLEPEFQKLSADLKLAEQALESAQITWDAAQRKKALGQGNYSSLKPAEAASVPLEKVGPNRGKFLLASTFVGLFLGLGLVLLMALPDTVVRTRNDLEGIEGLGVIGVMPRLEGRNLKRHAYRRKRGW